MSQPTQYESASAPEAPEPSGLALVASAIGRIARESKSEELEREGEQLVSLLRDWQEAHRRLEERARALRGAYEKVAAQLDETERERQQWHLRYLECEKALKSRPAAPKPAKKAKR
jgi:chromosome segregation ATPase